MRSRLALGFIAAHGLVRSLLRAGKPALRGADILVRSSVRSFKLVFILVDLSKTGSVPTWRGSPASMLLFHVAKVNFGSIWRSIALFCPRLTMGWTSLAFHWQKRYKSIVNSRVYKLSSPSVWGWAYVLLLTVAAGCGRNDVQVYRVSKEDPTPASSEQAAGMPAGHPDLRATAPPSLKYTLPPSWEEAPPGQMRVASFRVVGKNGKQAEVGVVPLPGLMGRDLENVNRWRSTVGLGAVREEDLSKLAQPVIVAGQSGQLYEQAGENPGSGEKMRILAAVSRQNNVAWFFKMSGDDELVAQQKPAFIEFLKSVSFTAGDTQAGLPPAHPPVGDTSMPLLSAVPNASSGGSSEDKPSWQVPAGWQEVEAGQFLVAKFMVTGGGNGQAAVNVSMSQGDGGGLAGNVNRWRGQLGLGPLSGAELNQSVSAVDTAGGKVSVVELDGKDARTGQSARLIGAIVPLGDRTWFYKLMGNGQVIESQKDAFMSFVKTAKY
jgi:hypothetical protein